MQHALRYFDDNGERFDAVLSALATAPLVKPETVRKLVQRFAETGADAIGTGTEIVRGHPYLAKIMAAGDDRVSDLLALQPGVPRYPRQVRTPTYFYNGALFLRDRRLVTQPDDDTNALGDQPRMLVISETEGMNVDSAEDLDFIRYRLERAG
jgi:CMP-N-acetylneuraminic acid synthetase